MFVRFEIGHYMTKSTLTIENGHEYWRYNGKLHREDGPAIVYDRRYNHANMRWYLNGKEYGHNFNEWLFDNPVSLSEKTQIRIKYGYTSIIEESSKYYPGKRTFYILFNGDYHREDGPAVIWENGKIVWCWYGRSYSFDDWCSISNISDKEKVKLSLKYLKK